MAEHGLSSSSSIDETETESAGELFPASKKRKPSGMFKTTWKLPKFITCSDKGNRFAFCKLCSSHFGVSHGGINDVKRHIEGSKHKDKFLESQKSASISNYFGECQQPSLIHTQKVMSAELMMCQFIAMHNLPFQAADHLTDLFPFMFADSRIASDYACKHTKAKAIICDALDPYLKKPVIDLWSTSPFNLLCDESNERGDSEKLLTVLIRAYEPHNNLIATRHLDTVGITDFTANGIFVALKETLQKFKLPFSNLVCFTSTYNASKNAMLFTCNVMKGVRGGVIVKLKEEQGKIIDGSY